jgi:hypothetical protein
VGFTGELTYPEKASAPGEFEHRGTYARALIVGKKEYALEVAPGEWLPFCKGVPRAAKLDYLLSGSARYSLPVKLRGAARGFGEPNVWRTVEKVRRANFNKRTRRLDGSLAPVVLNEPGE